jgi:spore coat-associated protein N
MKRKLLMSFLIIGLVSALVGGATFAYFTDTAANTNNVFTTGTIDIATDPASGTFNVTNMCPGDAITKNITVQNLGSLDLDYNIKASQASGDASLYDVLDLKITKGADVLYEGKLASLSITKRTLATLTNEDLTFTVSMDSALTGPQGATATVTFDFNAVQVGGPLL